jgi:enterochelin esterase-like enzyme
MHDGQNVLDPKRSTWGISWEVAETLTSLAAAGEVREAIVVAADCTRDRESEYDYAKSGARYADFLVSTLKPMIDARYRTQPGRENTFLMGASMGALISLTTLWHHPRIFARAAGLSFPAFYDHESTAAVLKAAPAPGVPIRFYLDYGDFGGDAPYEPAILRFAGFWQGFAPTSATLTWRKFRYADHNEAAWARRVGVPLRFLLQD